MSNQSEEFDPDAPDFEAKLLTSADHEEKVALLHALKNGQAIFAPGCEAEMAEHGMTLETLIRDLEAMIKKDMN